MMRVASASPLPDCHLKQPFYMCYSSQPLLAGDPCPKRFSGIVSLRKMVRGPHFALDKVQQPAPSRRAESLDLPRCLFRRQQPLSYRRRSIAASVVYAIKVATDLHGYVYVPWVTRT